MDGPKDPWPRVFSLPERFVGDPASLARDNIYIVTCQAHPVLVKKRLIECVVGFFLNFFLSR